MGRNRRKYSEDFKRDAVNQLISSGKSIAETAESLGIEVYNLSRWKNEFLSKPDKEGAVEEPAARLRRLEAENNRMAREITNLKQERDILKKAMGIVSKQ